MNLIRTAARNEPALRAYRVAMPRHRLRCRKRFRSGDEKERKRGRESLFERVWPVQESTPVAL